VKTVEAWKLVFYIVDIPLDVYTILVLINAKDVKLFFLWYCPFIWLVRSDGEYARVWGGGAPPPRGGGGGGGACLSLPPPPTCAHLRAYARFANDTDVRRKDKLGGLTHVRRANANRPSIPCCTLLFALVNNYVAYMRHAWISDQTGSSKLGQSRVDKLNW
jgi:hypothetical protein